jgi:hypothetical protein
VIGFDRRPGCDLVQYNQIRFLVLDASARPVVVSFLADSSGLELERVGKVAPCRDAGPR